MTNKLMIDCETLDIGECPIILSIGAVVFNDSSLVASLHVKISRSSCEAIGCTASEDTQKWWQQQSEKARESAFGGTADINEAMLKLIQVYEDYDCREIWSRGSLADIRWINNILDKLEIQKPWKYYEEMCFRTLVKTFPEIKLEFQGTPHNALDDAMHQAKHFIHINKLSAESKKGIFLTEVKATEIINALIDAESSLSSYGGTNPLTKLKDTLDKLSDELHAMLQEQV